jgi:hypothetical protein
VIQQSPRRKHRHAPPIAAVANDAAFGKRYKVSTLLNDAGRRLGRLAFAGVVERGDGHENGSSGGQTIEGGFALFHNLRRKNHGRIRGISYRCAILLSAARIVPIDKDAPAASRRRVPRRYSPARCRSQDRPTGGDAWAHTRGRNEDITTAAIGDFIRRSRSDSK